MKQEELDGDEFDPETSKNSKRDSGADPEVLAPDLLAACKANDEGWTQDLLADGVSPVYSDPESGMFQRSLAFFVETTISTVVIVISVCWLASCTEFHEIDSCFFVRCSLQYFKLYSTQSRRANLFQNFTLRSSVATQAGLVCTGLSITGTRCSLGH